MSQSSSSKLPSSLHIFYTILIFINNFCFGITLSLLGATMVDLSFIYDVSLNKIAYINLFLLAGYLTGSFGSYTYGFLPRQLVIAVTFLAFSLLYGLLPLYGHLYLAFGAIALGSVGTGAWDSAQSVWLCEIWAEGYPAASGALIQALQFMYGLGISLSPLFASHFVYGKANFTSSRPEHLLTTSDRVSSLEVPYFAAGALTAVVPLLFIIMHFVCPFRKTTIPSSFTTNIQEQVGNNLETSTVKSKLKLSEIKHRWLKIALVSLAVGTYIAGEGSFISYGSSMYQYLDGVHLSASDAAHVQSVLSATFTGGRLITALVSLKLPMDFILSYHYVLQLAALGLLYFGHTHGFTVILIGTAILGFAYSATWPGMFAFTEVHLVLTDRVGALFVALAAVVGAITPLVLGQTFKTTPLMLLYLTATYSAISFVLFLVVRFWIKLDERRNLTLQTLSNFDFVRKSTNNDKF